MENADNFQARRQGKSLFPGLKDWGDGFFSKPAVHLTLIVAIGLIAYSNTFHVPFVFDDETSITKNPVIRNLSNFLFGGAGYDYNPRRFIGYSTIALNYRLGGLDVTGYHIFNLAVHIISALLVHGLVRLTLRTPYFAHSVSLVPFFAALLFVAHPVQTQAVTYTVQRLASLATMFYLLSLVLYVKGRLVQESEKDAVSGKAVTLCLLSFVAAGLAMKTKETAFTLPFIVVLYEFFFFRMTAVKKLLFLLPLILTVLVVPLSLIGMDRPLGELISDATEMTRVQTDIPRLDYLFTQFRVIVTYIRLLFLPFGQNLDYDYPVYHSFFTPPVFFSFLFLCSILGLAVWLYRKSSFKFQVSGFGFGDADSTTRNSKLETRNSQSGAMRLIAFGILWFFITLSVESSIIPIVDVIFEHRLYLPSVGAFTALATSAALLLRNISPRRVAMGAAIAILFLAGGTFARNLVWRDPVALAEDMVRKSPRKARAHYNLARALSRAERYAEAFREGKIAVSLAPGEAKPHNLLGLLYDKAGMAVNAIEEFTETVRLDPDFVEAHNNLGDAYRKKGVMDKALVHYFVSQKLNPADPEIYNRIGLVYGETGQMDKAAAFFLSAASLDPANPAYTFNLRRAETAPQ